MKLTGRIRAMAWSGALIFGTAVVGALSTNSKQPSGHLQNSTELSSQSVSDDPYRAKIQPLIDRRCVVCHGCYTAPCQLNMTSFEGVMRGASKALLYDPMRSHSVEPTRLGIDAATTEEWRAKGFFSVTSSPANSSGPSIFESLLALKANRSHLVPLIRPEDSNVCPATAQELATYGATRPEAGMPYGLPELSNDERETFERWLASGAPGPRPTPSQRPPVLSRIEEFLNLSDSRNALVSRYLYEHLFLAHLHLEGQTARNFFRLVRSRTTCEAGADEIATRRPYDPPGVARFWYCFKPLDQTVVDKSHLPYEIGERRLARWRQLFFGTPWTMTKAVSYDPTTSANPFITFEDIPARARYQWLLDDAQYVVANFIRGPVCRGATAVNVIDEQFWVLFMNPNSDHFVIDPGFAKSAAPLLRLPAERGSDSGLRSALSQIPDYVRARNGYRTMRDFAFKEHRPNGYSLEDIWDGNGGNPNALLTVFRHYDSAYVARGALGPIPKTAYVLDYTIFERIYYDLVAGFDVAGNLTHQGLTRIYKHLLRMEAEENFLLFLPREMRNPQRDYWYRGFATQAKLDLLYPPTRNSGIPSRVLYTSRGTPRDPAYWEKAKQEFFTHVFRERLFKLPRASFDAINCCAPAPQTAIPERIGTANAFESEMRRLVARPAKEAKYVSFMDDTMLVRLVVDGGARDRIYTWVRNREHYNVAWISAEDRRREPGIDVLIATRGVVTSYPNNFLVVRLSDSSQFIKDTMAIENDTGHSAWLAKYAISRQNPDFWRHSDWFNARHIQADPLQSGLLDLGRYGVPTEE